MFDKILTIMKRVFVCLILFVFLGSGVQSQSRQSVYAELLGNGLIFSFNYDTRFHNKPDGIGARIGLGYAGKQDEGILLIPVQLNWLLGKNGRYFEIGAGATFASGNSDIFDEDFGKFIGTMTFGYRRQPLDGGFMWKIAITPVIADGFFWPYYGGLALGYAF